MFLTGNNPNELITTMNTEIIKVVEWLRMNKLSLNLKKTHFIIFRRQRAKVNMSEKLMIDNVEIENVEHTKFLGVVIDQNLIFNKHIQYIKSKVSRSLGIMYKCKTFFNQSTLVTLYNAFVYPYFTYCISVWGNTFECHIRPLELVQKRAVRLIIGARKYDHTDPIFDALKILRLKQIYIYMLFSCFYTSFIAMIFQIISISYFSVMIQITGMILDSEGHLEHLFCGLFLHLDL